MLETLEAGADDADGLRWLQQDGVTAHTVRGPMDRVMAVYPGRVISLSGDIAWPAKSPDLSVPGYFLLVTLESQSVR
ncbi:hypothetical protein Cfor_09993 [Coptotermes formosanus]|uniref:Uncharacterized protein n=1 Tax=Coptotermes formosanus TaxID=36987 RepID=A0A6L2PLW2_COPFO|nr:hypothetical protein Cfor_09993 [Coptotermes formosanus]